jgi:hypothetical protein
MMMTDEEIKDHQWLLLQTRLTNLLRDAQAQGFVITVEVEPRKPLAMGNVALVGTVRRARGNY